MMKDWLRTEFSGFFLLNRQEEFIAIWEEFEAGITAEAKYAKTMDRLEPLLQN